MFLSTTINTTSLVAPAVTLLLTFICYGKHTNYTFFFFDTWTNMQLIYKLSLL